MSETRSPLTSRMLQRISTLREEFSKHMVNGALIFHAMIVFRDDLENPAFGPAGVLQQTGQDITITLPAVDARQVIHFSGMETIEPPVWTQLGRQAHLPNAHGLLPQARKLLVEKPGKVADLFTVVREFNPETGSRAERFAYLAADAGRIVHELRECLAPHGIVDYGRDSGSSQDTQRWLITLHRLAWRGDPESGLHATRNTWISKKPGQVSFFPYDSDALRKLRAFPLLADTLKSIPTPPDRYISVVDQDLFLASLYAINDVVSLAMSTMREETDEQASEPSRVSREVGFVGREGRESIQTQALRDSVFISYSHNDERWLLELDDMLAPAVRNRVVKVWHDRKIKPAQAWRQEIAQQLARARVGVLLVTKDFLCSDFIQEEELPYLLEAATKEGVPLLWIAVDHCMYEHTPLKDIRAVNDPARPWGSMRGANKQREIKAACQKILEACEPIEE